MNPLKKKAKKVAPDPLAEANKEIASLKVSLKLALGKIKELEKSLGEEKSQREYFQRHSS
jgi:hypothetical protein